MLHTRDDIVDAYDMLLDIFITLRGQVRMEANQQLRHEAKRHILSGEQLCDCSDTLSAFIMELNSL